MKVLQLCHKPPYPAVDGASIAMYTLNCGLVENGHEVHVAAINTYKQYCNLNNVPQHFVQSRNYTLVDVDIRLRILPAFCNLFSSHSYNISRFNSTAFRQELEGILRANKYDVVLLESLFTAPYINTIRKLSNASIVLRSHNVEFHIWEKLTETTTNPFRKQYLQLLTRRLKKYELATLEQVDLVAAISNFDADFFKATGTSTPVIHVPFGIDFNSPEFRFYHEPQAEELVPFHIGSMDWIPHQEAFRWFLEKIWPAFHAKNPKVPLYLAGKSMPSWIKENNYPNVVVDDAYINGGEYMLNKAIMVVPSFHGSGIRIKIVEGLAKGKVIITTKNGAQGIPNLSEEVITISDNTEEWIQKLSEHVHNLEHVKNISRAARSLAEQYFRHDIVAAHLVNEINRLKRRSYS